MASTHRRRWWTAALLAAVAALLLLLLLLWQRDRGAGRASTPAGGSDEAAAAAGSSGDGRGEAPVRRSITPPAGDDGPPVARLVREYEDYKKTSIYPHWSFPLTPDMAFALDWNAAVTDEVPLGNGTYVRFDADAGRVFADQPYTSWIEAWREVDGVRTPVPLRITKAMVNVTSGPDVGEAFALAYRDDGKDGDAQAGDFRYTNRFVPSQRDELSRASQARVELYLEQDGLPGLVYRDFVFAPRPVLEVVGIRDAIVDGSLVVTLDCEVLEAGVYTFYGNLLAADGATPIAMTKLSYPLEAGRRQADLVFFGKVIHDQGLDGPYLVRDLHGLKREEADEGDVWWSHPAPHRTGPYRADQLSGAEWDAPERHERLANFERVIRELEEASEAR